ncbi:MAG: RNA-binding protein [Bacteroidota bacterium]|nr:RNA-binding protein [Bacteroidota bacterium]
MNIYVGNLDFKVNEDELQKLFEEYGTVSSAKIIVDKYSGRSKGFGFIEMDNDSEASQAIKDLDGSVIQDREVIVNEAKPRKERY